MIVRRPGEDEREVLDEGVIDTVLPGFQTGTTSTRRLCPGCVSHGLPEAKRIKHAFGDAAARPSN